MISSGLKEIIEGSAIAGAFKEIYASEFYYDESGAPVWPKLAVNFTAKTQFVYRINKGVLDVSDDQTLNASMPDDSKRVPFTSMIYMGDGLSDVPCMKMMRAYGGQAIAVYQAVNRRGVEQLLRDGRVDYIFPADYREGTDLELTMQNIIRKMAVTARLEEESAEQLRRGAALGAPGGCCKKNRREAVCLRLFVFHQAPVARPRLAVHRLGVRVHPLQEGGPPPRRARRCRRRN